MPKFQETFHKNKDSSDKVCYIAIAILAIFLMSVTSQAFTASTQA